MTDGQTIHHSVACGCAAGVAHPASGAQLRPASAIRESVNRCKYGNSETVTLASHSSCYNLVPTLIVMNGNKIGIYVPYTHVTGGRFGNTPLPSQLETILCPEE